MERQMVSSGRSLLSRPKGSSSSSPRASSRSEEHTSELQSRLHLVCRLLLEKKKTHSHLFPCNPKIDSFQSRAYHRHNNASQCLRTTANPHGFAAPCRTDRRTHPASRTSTRL